MTPDDLLDLFNGTLGSGEAVTEDLHFTMTAADVWCWFVGPTGVYHNMDLCRPYMYVLFTLKDPCLVYPTRNDWTDHKYFHFLPQTLYRHRSVEVGAFKGMTVIAVTVVRTQQHARVHFAPLPTPGYAH